MPERLSATEADLLFRHLEHLADFVDVLQEDFKLYPAARDWFARGLKFGVTPETLLFAVRSGLRTRLEDLRQAAQKGGFRIPVKG